MARLAATSPTKENLLYARVLGPRWAQLDERIRFFHAGAKGARGSFRMRRGRGVLARIVATLFGLPAEGDAVTTRLSVDRGATAAGPGELWTRTFGNSKLVSRQWATSGGMLAERFGCIELALRLAVERESLLFASAAASLRLGPVRLPLPRWIAPSVNARATAVGHGMHLRVCVAAPIAGELLEYEGELEADR